MFFNFWTKLVQSSVFRSMFFYLFGSKCMHERPSIEPFNPSLPFNSIHNEKICMRTFI